MVMSVIIREDGNLCVAHTATYDSRPILMTYAPGLRSLTLTLENGQQEHIGSAAMPEVVRSLHHAKQVTLMQLRRQAPAAYMDVPLRIQIAE